VCYDRIIQLIYVLLLIEIVVLHCLAVYCVRIETFYFVRRILMPLLDEDTNMLLLVGKVMFESYIRCT